LWSPVLQRLLRLSTRETPSAPNRLSCPPKQRSHVRIVSGAPALRQGTMRRLRALAYALSFAFQRPAAVTQVSNDGGDYSADRFVRLMSAARREAADLPSRAKDAIDATRTTVTHCVLPKSPREIARWQHSCGAALASVSDRAGPSRIICIRRSPQGGSIA
jgi:hypothetical protein